MNKNKGTFGLALASATAPTVTFLASSGSTGIDSNVSNSPVRLTNGLRDTTVGRYITGTENKASVTTLAFADALGMMLYGALGLDKVTGSQAPYTHDFKIGESLPELAFYQQVGSSSAALQKMSGAKVSKLGISAEGVTPPSVSLELSGTSAEWLSATSWNGPEFDPSAGWFETAGADVKLAFVGQDAQAVPSYMTLNSFEVDVENALTPATKLGEVEASAQVEGESSVKVSLSGKSTDTKVYRLIKTGSETGTAIAKAILTGSVQVTFKHTKHADWTLVVKVPAIPWAIEAMGVDVEGGPFDLSLSTDGAIALKDTSIEVMLQNATASYSA